jgi:hypothetical protein
VTENKSDYRDDDIRNRFAALRREEEAQAPKFALPSPAATPRVRWRPVGKLIAVAVCLLATAGVGTLWLHLASQRTGREPGKPVAFVTDWKAPTDFLLETPGRELLRTVPAIGARHDDADAPRQKGKHSEVKKTVLP